MYYKINSEMFIEAKKNMVREWKVELLQKLGRWFLRFPELRTSMHRWIIWLVARQMYLYFIYFFFFCRPHEGMF